MLSGAAHLLPQLVVCEKRAQRTQNKAKILSYWFYVFPYYTRFQDFIFHLRLQQSSRAAEHDLPFKAKQNKKKLHLTLCSQPAKGALCHVAHMVGPVDRGEEVMAGLFSLVWRSLTGQQTQEVSKQ